MTEKEMTTGRSLVSLDVPTLNGIYKLVDSWFNEVYQGKEISKDEIKAQLLVYKEELKETQEALTRIVDELPERIDVVDARRTRELDNHCFDLDIYFFDNLSDFLDGIIDSFWVLLGLISLLKRNKLISSSKVKEMITKVEKEFYSSSSLFTKEYFNDADFENDLPYSYLKCLEYIYKGASPLVERILTNGKLLTIEDNLDNEEFIDEMLLELLKDEILLSEVYFFYLGVLHDYDIYFGEYYLIPTYRAFIQAFGEIAISNFSKAVDGKFLFNEHGKVEKSTATSKGLYLQVKL